MSKWDIPVSIMGQKTINPIRRITDKTQFEPNDKYDLIKLSVGDPSVFGNLNPPEILINAVEKSVRSGKYNGYAASCSGHQSAREAVAKYASTPTSPLTWEDVVLASGSSGACEVALGALANSGDNILVSRPGYHQCRTVAYSYGIDLRFYRLLPERSWEADIQQIDSLIDEKTRCIVVNNPCNPCGSVYSEKHLKEILSVAEKHKVPILADEIYAYTVFKGETFYPIASLTETVPVLSVGGISKRFLVPGWRIGWILIHDRNGAFEKVRHGLRHLTNRSLGPNTIVQGALPEILANTPKSFFEETNDFIENNAKIAYDALHKSPGLQPVKPQGAMYMMIGIDKMLLKYVKDDIEFTQKLLAEKAVFCLPGQCFEFPNYFRVVLIVPEDILVKACKRICDFCSEILSSSETNHLD